MIQFKAISILVLGALAVQGCGPAFSLAPRSTLAKAGPDGSSLTRSVSAVCVANQHVRDNACVACGAGTTNAAGDDASGANTSCYAGMPSCQGLAANCGAGESCCASPTVTGGMFNRDNNASYPATVSSFRLDKYEVTVGRFRNFVAAVVGGWKPASGSGKHTHLNSGAGLANSAGGGNEPGWDTSWNTNLPADKATWDGSSSLACNTNYQTWTANSGGNETKPINCVNWYQSAAFCIWDGGFLPSEAEWNYAAAGGSEQRQYPWGAAVPGANASLAVYGCYFNGAEPCIGVTNIAPVGSVVAGNGLYGQADLAGNVWEWNLDWYATYADSCDNCANSAIASYLVDHPDSTEAVEKHRVARGGSFRDDAQYLLSSYQGFSTHSNRNDTLGLRCARTP